jgi:hypothetical protein
MFLQKPSPFTLTVKSRLAEIFLLRKHDVMIISESFPNIWKRINQNSYHNLVSIKELIHNILTRYYNTYFYNRDNKIVNMSKLDATIVSKLSRRSSGKSDISKVIRKTHTLTRFKSTIYPKNNTGNNTNENHIDLQKKRKVSGDTSNYMSFTDSFSSSPGNKKNKRSNSSNEDKIKNNNNLFNVEVGKIPFKKLTFKMDSPKNEDNKQSAFAKGINLMNKGLLTVRKSNKTAAFKSSDKSVSVSDNENYSVTEKISNYSSNKDGILILEDISAGFAKRIKKHINKRVKVEKIRNLFEFQKQQYISSLNELYSLINKQNSNNNQDILIYIQEKINEITSNNVIFSKILVSEEEETNISTQRNTQFDTKMLKKISSESFEIKSSYENINKII